MKRYLLKFYILFLSLISTYAQTESFLVHLVGSTSAEPWFIDSGHLNAGDYPDIVVGTYTGSTVEIYINNENGTFAAPIVKNLSYVYGVHIADLDGINGNDVIASSAGDNKLVWYANNGDGTFADEQIISSSLATPGNIVSGNIDADGTTDIAVVVYGFGVDTDRVVWFANDGLPWTEENVVPATAGLGPNDLDIADVDGDTDLDIVVANLDAGTIELYYNNYNPLTDNNPVSFTESAGGDISTGNTYLFDVSFADINDDTHLDILMVDLLTTSQIAYYQNDGSGNFSYQLVNNTHPNLSQAEGVDLDNDTYIDVVAVDGLNQNDDVFWYPSDDMGNLGSQTAITDNEVHNQIYGFTINDFDFDGYLDMATVGFQDDSLKWIENQLDGSLGIDDLEQVVIKVFPNPAASSLQMRGSYEKDYNVTVFDLLGKVVKKDTFSTSRELDISELQSGFYILKFEELGASYKFVKK
jgi:hypothetical protein